MRVLLALLVLCAAGFSTAAIQDAKSVSILPADDWLAGKYDVKVAVHPLLWPRNTPFNDHAVFLYLWDHDEWKAGLKPLEVQSGNALTLDVIWVNTGQADRLNATYPRISAPVGTQMSFSSSDPSVIALQKDGSWKALKKGTAWIYGIIAIKFIPQSRSNKPADQVQPLHYHWTEVQQIVVK